MLNKIIPAKHDKKNAIKYKIYVSYKIRVIHDMKCYNI